MHDTDRQVVRSCYFCMFAWPYVFKLSTAGPLVLCLNSHSCLTDLRSTCLNNTALPRVYCWAEHSAKHSHTSLQTIFEVLPLSEASLLPNNKSTLWRLQQWLFASPESIFLQPSPSKLTFLFASSFAIKSLFNSFSLWISHAQSPSSDQTIACYLYY